MYNLHRYYNSFMFDVNLLLHPPKTQPSLVVEMKGADFL